MRKGIPVRVIGLRGLWLGSCLLASSASAASRDPAPHDRELGALVGAQEEWDAAMRPPPASMPHVAPADAAKAAAHWRSIVARLGKIDRAKLSPDDRITFDVLSYDARVGLDHARFHEDEMPVNSDSSFWVEAQEAAKEPLPDLAAYHDYIARLRDLPRYFGEQIANMKAGAARGFTPPRVTMEGRDSGITAVTAAKSPEDTAFYAPFRAFPAGTPDDVKATLAKEGAQVIAAQVIPAYRRLLAFFDGEYVPHTREAPGASALPDGAAFYAAAIYEFTTTTRTPEDIHAFGLKEVARIHAEMIAEMKASGFSGDFPAFLDFLRKSPQFYAKTPEELLKDAAWIAKTFDAVSGQYFGLLPRRRFAIRPVPADEAPFYTSGRGGNGVYLVNTYDLPSRPLYSLPALTLHESAPGHAMQLPIVKEDGTLPAFRKQYISAYGEGWALYCERLGTEMGIYHTPYERFGMLSYQAWRAARLVVDTGLHSMNWTREQARQYLRDNTALAEREIDTEVDRYISWPGQALSYYLGESEIIALREKAQKALGTKFNIRAFHDAILKTGSVPLSTMDGNIDAFIRSGGKGPYPDLENPKPSDDDE